MIKYKLEILNGADTNQYLILLVKLVTVATPPPSRRCHIPDITRLKRCLSLKQAHLITMHS